MGGVRLSGQAHHGMWGLFRAEPGRRYPPAKGEFGFHPVKAFSDVIGGPMRARVECTKVDLSPGDTMVIHPGERHYM